MPIVLPTEAARNDLAIYTRLAGLGEWGENDCWPKYTDSSYRELVAAFRGQPLVGNVQKLCKTPNCHNPRHFRVMQDLPPVEVTPDMWDESLGCHVWNRAMVSGIPHLRFTRKNVNILHFLADRDLQDYRDLQAKMVGQKLRGFPRTPVVTRMCGRADCVNTAHFIVSPHPTGGARRINDYMAREAHRGKWFWRERADEHEDMTFASVNRWRAYKGLDSFDDCG